MMTDLNERPAETVGVIGLGRIGTGVARAVAKGGFRVVVCDLDPERRNALGEIASIADTPRELAEAADVVFIAVFDDAQVKEVLTGDAGVFEASSPARAVVVLSTVSLDTIRWAAQESAQRDVGFLDCGVAGGAGLEHGSIVSMVGGSDDVFAYARPVLESFSQPLMHMGPLGAGMRAKLARNMLHYCLALITEEAGRLSAACGIDGEKFVALVRARDDIGPGYFDMLERASAGVDGAAAGPALIAGYATKDIEAALQLANELGVQLPAARNALELYDRLAASPA